MKTELKKLVIEVGGKKLEFTPAEAKELKNILADLFGADKTTHVHHYDHNWWNRPYYYCSTGTLNTGGSIGCTTSSNSNGSAVDGTYTLTNSCG